MRAFLFFIIICAYRPVFAATITSAATGNWSATATWVGGVPPVAGDVVTIASGHTITVNTNAACSSITIGNAATACKLSVNSGFTLTVSGNITIAPPSGGTNDNILDVNQGTVICTDLSTSNSGGNSRRCLVTISTGTLTCSGNFILGGNALRNLLTFTSSGLLQVAGSGSTLFDAQFTASTGKIEYNGVGTQTVAPLSYYSLKCSNSGVKSLYANTTLLGNLEIAGTAQLDVTTSNYSLMVAGNWSVTSTNADPFIQRAGRVNFNGTTSTQLISTVLSKETFYELKIDHSSISSPSIRTSKHIEVTQAYIHHQGSLDLQSKNLTINSLNNTPGFVDCQFIGGGNIFTSSGNSTIDITDANDSTYVKISNFSIGTASRPINLTINVGRLVFENFELYGTANFTKTFDSTDASYGGNKFHHDFVYTVTSSSARVRMGDGATALPDTFFAKATFNAFANGTTSNNNFIVGANTIGNYYADTVKANSTTVGGLYFGRQNGGANSLHTFAGHVEVNVQLTGNVKFANGTVGNASTVVFLKTLRMSSSVSSTGDVYVGNNDVNSIVTLSSSAQIIPGTVSGDTKLYFYGVTQNGSLAQTIKSKSTGFSNIVIGSSTAPCTWNGPLSVTGSGIDLAYSTFNGSANSFSMTGSSEDISCTGGNTFAAGTTSTFVVSGSSTWFLAAVAGDDYNGDVVYDRTGSGNIIPAYNANCTYAGNITRMGTSSIGFTGSGTGRVTIDGNTSTSFSCLTSSLTTTMQRLTMNKTSGNFTLNQSLTFGGTGEIVLTSGKIITSSSGILIAARTTSIPVLTTSSTSYVDGPMCIVIGGTGGASVSVDFPIGKGSDCRPIKLSVQHAAGLIPSYYYTAEVFNASANALGWTYPATVDKVSLAHYWDIARTTGSSSGPSSPSTHLLGNASLTLLYDANDGVTDPSKLTICKNTSGAATTWIDIGGSGSAATTGSITSTSSPSAFNSFSRFTLGNLLTGINPLPIELVSFKAVPKHKEVVLSWETATEINNSHFDIERSVDGKTFEQLATIAAKNNGNYLYTQHYNITDHNPYSGLSYYRLKQTDKTSEYSYSNIVAVDFTSAEKTINIYPNPTKDVLNIRTDGLHKNITIINALGIILKEYKMTDGLYTPIDVSNLSAGIYYLVTDQDSLPVKFVVQ